MSISIYQILAEQSPAASLPIINENYRILCDEINKLEQYIEVNTGFNKVRIQFDFNPINIS